MEYGGRGRNETVVKDGIKERKMTGIEYHGGVKDKQKLQFRNRVKI